MCGDNSPASFLGVVLTRAMVDARRGTADAGRMPAALGRGGDEDAGHSVCCCVTAGRAGRSGRWRGGK